MYSLPRYRAVYLSWAMPIFACAVLFWAGAAVDLATMEPNVFGPISTMVDVEAWVGMQMAGSALFAMGVMINGRWRWSPVLRWIAATALAVEFGTFTYSAALAPQGFAVAAYIGCMTLVFLYFSWLALIDSLGAIRRWS